MIIQESKLLRESVEQYLILESRQILLENIKNNPRQYFIINEDYKKYCTEEEWKVIEEGIWDTISGAASSIGDWFSENPRQGIQSVADVVSIFDPTGIVDLVNGIFYYYFKDYFSAFFSFLGAALTMGGLLLTASVAGAAVGVPMEVAGKAAQTLKVAAKAGKVSEAAVKDIAIGTKMAAPALGKIAKTVENIPFIGGAARWLTKSTDNVAALATKETATITDVSKAVGSTSTEMANNPVVKGFTSRVVDVVKKQGFKPSKLQVGFAGLGAYGIWMQADNSTLRKVAIEQLKQSFEKQGLKFDPNDKSNENSISMVAKALEDQRNGCKSEEECKGFLEKHPGIAAALAKIGQAGHAGGEFIGKFDPRNA